MQIASRCLGRERQTAPAEERNVELMQIQTHDHWTRVEVLWIPSRRGQKQPSATGNENLADRLDEDNFRRGPATYHQLEPVDDENVSKKA